MAKLDYPYTCPEIDVILKDMIWHIDRLGLEEEVRSELVDDITNNVDRFRNINQDLRNAAEKQIQDVEDKYENELLEYQEEIERLKNIE